MAHAVASVLIYKSGFAVTVIVTGDAWLVS